MELHTPRVAVITPYFREEHTVLAKCHESVLAQTFPCLHVLVADGYPLPAVDKWDAHHVKLPISHNDIGSTPRLVGAYHAIGLGVDAVAFLDADNWYAPQHIGALVAAGCRDGAAVVSSGRTLCQLDGTPIGPCPSIDPDRFVDTNCMFFGREAFHLLHHWVLMPDYGHLIGDRIMLFHIKRSGLRMSHVNEPSVYYRCGKEGVYRRLNIPAPPGIQPRPNFESSFERWIADGNPPLI